MYVSSGTIIYFYFFKCISLFSQAERKERVEIITWFKTLSDLRGKERSLQHGDFYGLEASNSSLSFLRLWDQSERFITIVNFGTSPETIALKSQVAGKSYLSDVPINLVK